MNEHRIESGMFRVSNEYLALLLGVGMLILISVLLSTFNLYVTFALIILGITFVQLHQAQFLGSAIRVHENQFSHIFDLFKKNAIRLSIPKATLYIIQDPIPNAYTIGITSCTVVLTSALVEQFNHREIDFTLGHELGHYKAGHTKISSLFIPIGTGNIFSNLVFGFWQRKAEYTADRCGLIVTKDIDSAITSLIKLTIGGKLFEQFNVKGYLSQIKKADSLQVRVSEILVDHPLTTNRIKGLLSFWKENFTSHEM